MGAKSRCVRRSRTFTALNGQAYKWSFENGSSLVSYHLTFNDDKLTDYRHPLLFILPPMPCLFLPTHTPNMGLWRVVDGKQRQQTSSSSHIHTVIEVKSRPYTFHTPRIDDYRRCPCNICLCRGRAEKLTETRHSITEFSSGFGRELKRGR